MLFLKRKHTYTPFLEIINMRKQQREKNTFSSKDRNVVHQIHDKAVFPEFLLCLKTKDGITVIEIIMKIQLKSTHVTLNLVEK